MDLSWIIQALYSNYLLKQLFPLVTNRQRNTYSFSSATAMTFITLFMVAVVGAAHQSLGQEIKEEIWNGENATAGLIAYQALLINQFQNKNATFCGGSLIALNYVLTAAHCSYQTSQTSVYLGLTNTSDGSKAVFDVVPATRTFVHSGYNPQTYQNDISLLRLSANVQLTNYIKTIMLPKIAWASPTTFDNYTVTASGWGQTQDNEEGIHPMLQWTRVNKMTQASCVSYYAKTNAVTNNMICTDKVYKRSGPCHGDSGGPLTVQLASGLYLIGDVSWGVGACSSTNPVVYGNIASFLPWINGISGIPIS